MLHRNLTSIVLLAILLVVPAAAFAEDQPAADQTATPAAKAKRPKGAGWRAIGYADAVSAGFASEPVETVDTRVDTAPRRPSRSRLGLAAGYQGIGMSFRAQTADSVMDYEAAANALMLSAGGTYSLVSASSSLVAEIDGAYALSYADSGMHYLDAAGAYYEVPFSAHTVRAGASLGYRRGERLEVAARLGYQLEATLFQRIDQRALLPRERLHGLAVGGRVRLVPGWKSLAMRLGGDIWLMGERVQTGGLEDGTDSRVSVWSAHAGLDYPLVSQVNVSLHYVLQRASTEWNGASSRFMGVDHATRDDVSYMIYIGVSRGL